jgi:hypothetical protein
MRLNYRLPSCQWLLGKGSWKYNLTEQIKVANSISSLQLLGRT